MAATRAPEVSPEFVASSPEVTQGCGGHDKLDLPESLKAKIVDPKSFSDIPVLDLRLDEAQLVEQLRYACEVVGFMQVVGHGISTELQQQHTEMQRRFFSLPQRAKEELALSEECPVRGYFGKGGEDLDRVLGDEVDAAKGQKVGRQARKDNKEGLDMNGAPWSKPAGGFTAQIFGMPSQLPAEEVISGFEEVMHEYAGEMFQLARRLLSLMALVLGRPRGFFEEHITKPVATHRLLHYWPLRDLAREIGVGEHTDYGLLTLLKQDEVGGLQVLSAKDEGWVHCPPLHDAFVVNLGDMLGRWTGHHFKSTVHRVVNTSSRERFSVPFFLEPNLDTLIEFGALRPPREEEEEREERKREPFNGEDVRGHYGGAETAEQILERFYRASGQLRAKGQGP